VTLNLSQMADRQINGDPEEPRVRAGIAAEALQLHQSPRERLLGELAGFVEVADEPEEGVVEAVLIGDDQLAVRASITMLSFSEEVDFPAAGEVDGLTGFAWGFEVCSTWARHGFGRGRVLEVPWNFFLCLHFPRPRLTNPWSFTRARGQYAVDWLTVNVRGGKGAGFSIVMTNGAENH
jgi:hypothetical protein